MPDARLTATLSHLADEAQAIRDKLPGFSCMEVVTSKDLKSDGSLKYRVEFTAEVTVKRDAEGKLKEHFTVTTLNGQPDVPQKFNLPVYMEGGFRMAFDTLTTKAQPCYRYTLKDRRIDFEAIANPPGPCNSPPGTRGFALLNEQGGADAHRATPARWV